MDFAVGDAGNQEPGPSELFEDDLYDLDVGYFVVAAEVLGLADSALLRDCHNTVAVIIGVNY